MGDVPVARVLLVCPLVCLSVCPIQAVTDEAVWNKVIVDV